jgi:hypothetical protein
VGAGIVDGGMRSLAVAAACAVLTCSGADARPACRLLGAGQRSLELHELDDAVKITSADVASNRTHLTVVIRLQSVSDPLGPAGGRELRFHFSRGTRDNWIVEGQLWGTAAAALRLGKSSEPYGTGDGFPNIQWRRDKVTAVVDQARNELRMSVPMSAFAGSSVRPGARVTYLGAETHRAYGVSPFLLGDPNPGAATHRAWRVAGGTKVSYVLGSPSCVPVGR